ncbi:DedA family protein [Corynebacterium caspium]|uniref:DedA family protein n=1 Tax=Corynebacterium caspium TaxID=234828 RepID=UPI0012E9F928|nr:DedA family protein [Corynebacterium caspium]
MSLWFIYPALGLFVIGDALIPFIPAETLLTLASSWTGSRGIPNFWGIFFTGLIAAMIGDNLSYFLGGRMFRAGRKFRRLPGASKVVTAVEWAQGAVTEKPGFTIIVARFIPWARWVLTIILGSTRYPWWKFFIFDTIGAAIWSFQACCVGYVGGRLVSEYPLIGMVIGLILGGLVGFGIDRIGSHYREFRQIQSATASA